MKRLGFVMLVAVGFAGALASCDEKTQTGTTGRFLGFGGGPNVLQPLIAPFGGNNNGANANDNGANANDNGANTNDNGANANDNGNGNGSICADGSFRVRFRDEPSDSIKGEMIYRLLPAGCERFRVKVEGFAVGAFDVTINAVVVGQVMVGSDGKGELEFDSDDGTLPVGFPMVSIGDVGDVGGIVGGTLLLSCSETVHFCDNANGNGNANDNGGNTNDNGANANDNGANANDNGGNTNDNGAGNTNTNGAGNGNANGP